MNITFKSYHLLAPLQPPRSLSRSATIFLGDFHLPNLSYFAGYSPYIIQSGLMKTWIGPCYLLYQVLQWLSIVFRIKSKVYTMTQVALCDLAPNNPSNLRSHPSAPVILTFLMVSTRTSVFATQSPLYFSAWEAFLLGCLHGLFSHFIRTWFKLLPPQRGLRWPYYLE